MKKLSDIFPGLDLPRLDSVFGDDERAARSMGEQRAVDRMSEQEKRLIDRGVPLKDVDVICGAAASEFDQTTEAMQAVLADEKRGQRIIVLSGNPGCGKTLAAGYWVGLSGPSFEWNNPFGQRVRGARFVPVSQLERVSRYDANAMADLELARRLVVDDLGDEFVDQKGQFNSLIDGVLNFRYSNKLPTLLTTNLSATDFKLRYGERIADRIRESGRFVSLSDPSLRRRQRTAVVSDSNGPDITRPEKPIEHESRAGVGILSDDREVAP